MENLEMLKFLDVKLLCSLIAIIGSLAGVIIGAILAFLFTIFTDWLNFMRKEQTYLKRKREETYIEMEDLITDYCAHTEEMQKKNAINEDIKRKYNDIRTKAHIYVNKKISDDFYKLMNNVMIPSQGIQEINTDDWDILTQEIKKDLGIKD